MTTAANPKPFDFLATLNPNQRAAVQHDSGPLLVIAGAGSGKTKTLATRVAALIRKGVAADTILLLTFTRRAANEMIRRAGHVVGEAAAAGVWGGTFHAVAHRLLRMHSQGMGLSKSFTVMDQGDAEDLLHLIRTDFNLHKSQSRFPQKSTLLAIYSRCVNTGEPLEQVLPERFPWCATHHAEVARVFREYMERKTQRELLDYDDLLLYWEQALDTAGVGAAIGGRFRHVLVDEYQDTNPIQAAILQKMWLGMTKALSAGPPVVPPSGRSGTQPPERGATNQACSIMVVGDDAQSIYSFRGATIENILRFPEQFANATTVTLDQNYRSVVPILDASNAVMDAAKRRFTKNLWSDRPSTQKPVLVTCANEIEQSNYVADRVLEHREEGISLMRQAVLFRASHNSDALEVELSRRNIPFVKWGGLRFLEAAHIKDLLAFLRILENPHDDLSWMRILQMLNGVGPGRARSGVEQLHENRQIAQALRTWKAPAAAQEQVAALAKLVEELAGHETELPLPAQIERIRRFYAPIFEERYEQPEMRARDLDQLELLSQQASSRAAFLTDLTLDPPMSTGDLAGPPMLDEEYTVLSTIHSAKGCEWDVVYVIHAADGVLPSDMSMGEAEIEEERRLLYVAMTRARARLYVTFPLRYYHRKHAFGDSHSFAQLSRFLPPDIFPLFERANAGNMEQVLSAPQLAAAPVAEQVQRRLRELWK
ncbi:MAG TPA: ATP-dependent helicase, partial [Gemmataceae bacterium]|nr:ATP-dependent helicase [Gemmataceae bacterium]